MSRTTEEVSELFSALGERIQEIEEIFQDASAPLWAIALEGDMMVTVEFDPVTEVLSFTSDLGQPPPEHRLAVCEALMTYSSLQQATGGVTMALTQPKGEFMQLCDVSSRDVDVELLQHRVMDFADKARLWRQIIAQGVDAPQDSDGPVGTRASAAGIQAV